VDFDLTEEQQAFRASVLAFGREQIAPRAREHDLNSRFDHQSWKKLAEFGIFGLHFPERYGGAGAEVVTTILAGEALGEAGVDSGLMLSYGAHAFLCADTILVHGTEEQRRRCLPKLISGEWIGCMGLTEPGAGSDVAALRTRAERVGDRYRLNGSKIFITNGPLADLAVVYATVDPKLQHAGISAFLVEKGTKGFSAGPPMHKLGMRASMTSELFFEDCEIPAENLLGAEGGGFPMAMQTVEWDRSALLAPMVGGMTFMLARCARYATERIQFGRPIASYQAIKQKLANIKIFLEAARGLIYRIAWCKDQGRPLNHLEAAVAKLFVGDSSLGPSNDALTLLGGYGYSHEYEIERLFRDIRLAAIGGGTSEIQKLIISKLMEGPPAP
jgi:alkylation response protein AidB-like acyl-CoA dehydrogenase